MTETSEIVREMHEALRNFPANGRPGWTQHDTGIALIVRGYIQTVEVNKACKCCGIERLDYTYFRITAAGRQFLDDRNEIEALTAWMVEHDRFQREGLGYSGPEDPGLDPACAEQWSAMTELLSKEAAQIEGAGQ